MTELDGRLNWVRVEPKMTDLELTKMCEAAIGLDSEKEEARRKRLDGAWRTYQEKEYDPLHDDAQAMALVKKFALMLEPDGFAPKEWCVHVWYNSAAHWERTINKDLNRAIVECVAKMQKAKYA